MQPPPDLDTDRTHTSRRRLAAILFMDVVGYSRLIEQNEEATLAALRQCRDMAVKVASDHGGRLVSTAGDAFLLQFDSAVEAVGAARQLQASYGERNRGRTSDRQMVFRMGVNVGDIVEQDGSVYGDGVNIAARLQALAEPGGILTSANVIEQVADKLSLDVDDIGDVRVKNINRPIRAYRLRPPAHGSWSRRRPSQRVAYRQPGPNLPRPKRWVALILALILGFFGVHRFYMGRTGTGLLMLVTIGGIGVWWIADVVMLASGDLRDASGRAPDWF